MADIDTLVLQAVLDRIADQKLDLNDALNDLDIKARELTALREFKKRIDDATIGKGPTDSIDLRDVLLKDGVPAMVEVNVGSKLGVAVSKGTLETASRAKLEDILQNWVTWEQGKPWRWPTAEERKSCNIIAYDRARAADKAADVQRAKDRQTTALNGFTDRIANERQKAADALSKANTDGHHGQRTVQVSLLSVANAYDIKLESATKVPDLQKLVEQLNNMISDVSTDAQKLQTIVQDKHQQLTQLVSEASRMTRIRHEGRLTTNNRLA